MFRPTTTAIRLASLPVLLVALAMTWHPAAPVEARPATTEAGPPATKDAGPTTTRPPKAPRMSLVPHSKVGSVDGTRAFIALSFDGRHLRVFVCDGGAKRNPTISQWFKSRWDGRSAIALVRNGIELRIDAVHPDGRVTGHVTAFSGPHPFTAEPATGPAGLYDGVDRRERLRATWIVRADGSFRGNMAPTRPPRRICRLVTVALSDGTTTERVACYDV
jgi:hypothetical protein